MAAAAPIAFDAVLILSFGGPEGPDEVLPFLERVLRGRNVPRERMLEVAEHYYHFGGVSPINAHNRELVAALQQELNSNGPRLPVYWGNRNWPPLLADTLRQMAADGIRQAAAFVTSAFSSYSSCRQYQDDIARARAEVGEAAPEVVKLRPFFNHPGFIEPMIERLRDSLAALSSEEHTSVPLVFTAHSIPLTMAQGCDYELQLREASRLVAEGVGRSDWTLAYQSRSGPPSQPWLEPDIGDVFRELAKAKRSRQVVVVPIGFLSDHMEVIYDLDTEARAQAEELGLELIRVPTVGNHSQMVQMVRKLVIERSDPTAPRLALGQLGPRPLSCPADCCPSGRRIG